MSSIQKGTQAAPAIGETISREAYMHNFVELGRRFSVMTGKDLKDPEVLAALDEFGIGASLEWHDLLEFDRLVLLAEAGSGKTVEFRARKRRLVEQGKAAFFVRLELLQDGLEKSLESSADLDRYDAWRQNGKEPAWFFLDALDELKLSNTKLDAALIQLSHKLDDHSDRAKVLISCRASDLGVGDLGRFADLLPKRRVDQDQGGNSDVKTVIMHPLNNKQICVFASQLYPDDADAFLGEVSTQDAWGFARRPLDLKLLMASWRRVGKFGTRRCQQEENVRIRLVDEDTYRADSGVLSDQQKRQGSESLALALKLTRTGTLCSPNQFKVQELPSGILEPADVLADWTEAGRRALLRTGVFDPATSGRVRFHHATVREYLAACRLRKLREKGMSIKALFRLLFTEKYQQAVVFPSMREIATWLAIWDTDVCKELIKREPEALLSLGDPESLILPTRCRLVREFANRYGDRGLTDLGIPIDKVRSIACPELGHVIRECWDKNPVNPVVREFLTRLIRFGQVKCCSDLVLAVATDPDENPRLRIDAILAMLGCGMSEKVKELADDMVSPTSTSDWPAQVVHGISKHLFPDFINADGLVFLMEKTTKPQSTRPGGLKRNVEQIVDGIEPGSKMASSLRDGIADLIWRGRSKANGPVGLSSNFSYFSPALAKLCVRQLATFGSERQLEPIRASVIASMFSKDQNLPLHHVSVLREYFLNADTLRREGFWAQLDLMDDAVPVADDRVRFHKVNHYGLVGPVGESDRKWLWGALSDEERPDRRGVALCALISLRQDGIKDQSELEEIRACINGDSGLTATLEKLVAPPPPPVEQGDTAKQEARRRRLQQEGQATEQELQRGLQAVTPDPFSPDNRETTLLGLYKWLCRKQNAEPGHWDSDAIALSFGQDIAGRAGEALNMYWRSKPPVLWSCKLPEEGDQSPYLETIGLLGVKEEASNANWPDSLSPEDARKAVAYATLELGKFPQFFRELAETHRHEVKEVIGGEMCAELRQGANYDHLPIFENLANADQEIKQLFVPRLLVALGLWPQTVGKNLAQRWSAHLVRILAVLTEATSQDQKERRRVAQNCQERFRQDPTGLLAPTWLKGMFMSDAGMGARALIKQLEAADPHKDGDYAIRAFASICGWDSSLVFEKNEFAGQATDLGLLVSEAFRWVRPEDDVFHEGVYAFDDRDRAEFVRLRLLDLLCDLPGPEANLAMVKLARDKSVGLLSDRLKVLARQNAAKEAEFTAFSPWEVVQLEKRYEAPPTDRDGLFQVMVDRLEDLQHEFTHGDLSDRRTVQNISREAELQRTLASRLRDRANGAYRVTREEEVADSKRIDIRLHSTNGNHKAVIEVKIAERWSLNKLEWALENQLVGQYLMDDNCRAGCLLLTRHVPERCWVHSESKRCFNFTEMVEYLNNRALQIDEQKAGTIRVKVFGLDLTDPG